MRKYAQDAFHKILPVGCDGYVSGLSLSYLDAMISPKNMDYTNIKLNEDQCVTHVSLVLCMSNFKFKI